MGAKDVLQVGKAAVAQRLGKADECGGLHPGELRDAGNRAEGDLLRIGEREVGDLDETLGQRRTALLDQGADGLEVARYGVHARRPWRR